MPDGRLLRLPAKLCDSLSGGRCFRALALDGCETVHFAQSHAISPPRCIRLHEMRGFGPVGKIATLANTAACREKPRIMRNLMQHVPQIASDCTKCAVCPALADSPGGPGAFVECCHYKEIRVGGRLCCLSHYPMLDWNMACLHHGVRPADASFMLHGHIHSRTQAANGDTARRHLALRCGRGRQRLRARELRAGLRFHRRARPRLPAKRDGGAQSQCDDFGEADRSPRLEAIGQRGRVGGVRRVRKMGGNRKA